MFKFAINLTLQFAESNFLDRIARARAAGFRYVEFHNPFPYDQNIQDLVAAVRKQAVQVIHFNLPAPGWENGERGIAARPDAVAEFRAGVNLAREVAQQLACRQLNCPVGTRGPEFSLDEQRRVLIDNLSYAANVLAQADMTLLLEPLNPITHPNYLLTTTQAACELQDQVGAPNLKIQYDYYQMQRAEGELAETVRQNFARIGFIQLADNPGRHQPGTGEINFRFLLKELARLGYMDYVSLEYIPTGTSEAALTWLDEYGFSLDPPRA